MFPLAYNGDKTDAGKYHPLLSFRSWLTLVSSFALLAISPMNSLSLAAPV